MASIYFDHDTSRWTAGFLRVMGHTVTTTVQLQRERATDPDQLLFAAQQGWILVTHNRKDYELLHDAWLLWASAWNVQPVHAGIVIIPQTWSATRAASEIDSLVTTHSHIANQLYQYDVARNRWALITSRNP